MPSRRWRQRDVRRRRDHEKCSTQVDVVCRSLGVPGPRSQPRWWIVRNVDEVALAALEPAEWKLEHVFLRTSDGSESRVTKKSSVGGDDLGVPRRCLHFLDMSRLHERMVSFPILSAIRAGTLYAVLLR